MNKVTFTLRSDDFVPEFERWKSNNPGVDEAPLRRAALAAVVPLPSVPEGDVVVVKESVKVKGHTQDLQSVAVVVPEGWVKWIEDYCKLRDLPEPTVVDVEEAA